MYILTLTKKYTELGIGEITLKLSVNLQEGLFGRFI